MTKEYTPGQDCNCHAYGENECGCGADWTPSEVYELREKLAAERALADRLAGVLQPLLIATWREKQPSKAELAFTAWKEARSE